MDTEAGRALWSWPVWVAVAAAVLGASVAFVAATGMRPSYDPFGWMVWGHQLLYGHLNTDGAPSWKPLTFVFTLPYALFGRFQMRLWTVTSVAGSLAGGVLAARIAYRLTGRFDGWGRVAPLVGAAFGGVGVLGIQSWAHLVLIANADQLNTTLLLAAIDAHLSSRPRLAFVALWLAALGRPEVWPFLLLYGGWSFLRVPGMRVLAVVGLVLVPAFWFVVPALTSRSWWHAGELALNQHTAIEGSKVIGVLSRWRGLYELPMQLAAVVGVGLALLRRDLVTLWLTAAALLWVVIEIALAYHGFSAVSRYLIEPAAVMVVIGGGAVGQLLAGLPRLGSGRAVRRALGALGPLAVVALLVALVPAARSRTHVWRAQIPRARRDGRAIERLADVVELAGGEREILRCGQPVARVQYQSTLAWTVGLNVGTVGYHPGKAIRRGEPIVLFEHDRSGWRVRPYNQPASDADSCSRQVRVEDDR